MCNSILLAVGHDQSLYLLFFLHQKQIFSCDFARTLTWLCKEYDSIVFAFYWLFVNTAFGD